MSKLFNVTSTGTFTGNQTFTRPLTSSLGIYESGTISKPITIISPAGVIGTEPVSLRGVFLNVDYVHKDATSTFTITLKGVLGITHTYTYNVSSLYKEYNKRIGTTTSQYWQGFNLLDLDISWTPQLEVQFSCTSEQDLKLVGGAGTNYNHYFIPSTVTDYLSATPNPGIRIGSYLSPIQSTDISGTYEHSGALPSTYIINDAAKTNTTDIIVWNQATLALQNNTEIINSGGVGIIAAPGSVLSAVPGCILTLNGGSPLIGLNGSTITLSGTDKLPYTFLDIDYPAGAFTFTTTDNINTWGVGDSVLLTGNSAVNTTERGTITAVNAGSFNILAASLHNHLSINNSFNIFGEFRGAPVVNVARDTVVRASPASYIRAEDSCELYLYNTQLSNLGVIGSSSSRGAVNLFNTSTIIDKCSICTFPIGGVGISIDTKEASSFTISNNSICNTQTGIIQEKRPSVINSLLQSVVSGNVIVNSQRGIATNYTDTVTYNNNIVSHSAEDGFVINTPGLLPVLPRTVIKEIDSNLLFANRNGIILGNVDGSFVTNITCIDNRQNGVVISPSTYSTRVSGISSAYNTLAGVVCNGASPGTEAEIYDVHTHHNDYIGLSLNSIHNTVSSVSATHNGQESVFINNCNKGILYLHDIYVNNNNKSVAYSYGDSGGFNFFPTYLIGGNIDTAKLEPTCITLFNTKCEKFVVHDIIFNSSGPNVTLIPLPNSFIEGSYLFSDCIFSDTPFDELSAKYQTEIFSEAGFVSMYHNKIYNKHYKYTPAGLIQSDFTEFKDPSSQISEKLTPQSATLKLKSSKKVIFIDNFDSSVPPNLEPEYLNVSVWVKKNSEWGSNDDPRLIIASNPTLRINEDTIIDTHSASTTDWFQLTSIVPVASAIDTRGAVEMYVDCSGSSGGSIFIDKWSHTITRSS